MVVVSQGGHVGAPMKACRLPVRFAAAATAVGAAAGTRQEDSTKQQTDRPRNPIAECSQPTPGAAVLRPSLPCPPLPSCPQGPMGAHGSIAANLYLNVLQPHHQAVWGSTVQLYTPGKQLGVECLEVRPQGLS